MYSITSLCKFFTLQTICTILSLFAICTLLYSSQILLSCFHQIIKIRNISQLLCGYVSHQWDHVINDIKIKSQYFTIKLLSTLITIHEIGHQPELCLSPKCIYSLFHRNCVLPRTDIYK